MLKQYYFKLHNQYKQTGIISAMKLLNETFVDYLFLELNTLKLKQLKRTNILGDDIFPRYIRLFSPNLLEEIGKKGIDKLIKDIQLDFLSGCEEH